MQVCLITLAVKPIPPQDSIAYMPSLFTPPLYVTHTFLRLTLVNTEASAKRENSGALLYACLLFSVKKLLRKSNYPLRTRWCIIVINGSVFPESLFFQLHRHSAYALKQENKDI